MTENQSPSPSPERGGSEGSLIQAVERFCIQAVRHMKLQVHVRAFEDEGAIRVDFSGPDRPLLLTGAAAVLNSMEYLVNKIFRTGRGDENPAIVLDSELYRQHREAELVLLAQMASKKVLDQGKPMSLQPMTPKERRIVHLALASIDGVRSQSQGDGEDRSITIYPS